MSQSMTAWDDIFAREGRVFLKPHEDMPKVVQMLKAGGASTILDLGSYTGRHVVYLAKSEFSVFGAQRQLLGNYGSNLPMVG